MKKAQCPEDQLGKSSGSVSIRSSATSMARLVLDDFVHISVVLESVMMDVARALFCIPAGKQHFSRTEPIGCSKGSADSDSSALPMP